MTIDEMKQLADDLDNCALSSVDTTSQDTYLVRSTLWRVCIEICTRLDGLDERGG